MQQGKFKRQLNLADLTFLGLGAIIGSGWLFSAFYGAAYAGSDAWIAWVFGAVAVGLIALVYAELGAAWPRSGGVIRYPEFSHGSLAGYLNGFAYLLATSSVAGIEASAVRQYATHYIPALSLSNGNYTGWGLLVEIVFLALFFLINYWSVNIFGKVNSVVTALKFIMPLLTLVLLLTQLHGSNFSITGASPGGAHGIFTAVASAGIVFSFLGFRQPVEFAGEAKNPQRTVPLAILLSIVLGAIIYVLLQIAFVGAIPASALSHGWGAILNNKNLSNSPFATVALMLGFGWLSVLLFADAVLSPAGTGNIYLSSTARMSYAWSKNGYFYSIFSRVDPRTGLPRPALVLSFILAVVWILPANFHSWSGLVTAVTSATVLTYVLGPVTLSSLRKSAPDHPRPFKLGGHSIIAPLAFVAGSWIVYWSGWTTDRILIALTLGSLILYFAFMDRNHESLQRLKRDWKSGAWVIVYYIVMGIMTYIGSFGPLKHPLISGPWLDSIVVGVLSLIFYYWGVASRLPAAQITTDAEEDLDVG
ncbi:APC family permease [Sulfobacillus harzensis]|uniref:APC family permease n=1 Tax=Sulfobacillus harzensis TaxID=2729629 RepID=A0A7Y0Q260_9FIRM|nr:APC family permease [Sulfobacillus harzensis]NMP22142.1 APC family permease [Sulfobacillus harzensis]